MHGFALTMTWTAFATGIVAVAIGTVTLASKTVALPFARRRMHWQGYGLGMVLLGIWVTVETVPWLADASPDLMLALSVVAFVPLAAAITLLMRARRT